MIPITASLSLRPDELVFRTSRAGGPGGQHVNRTESRVELFFDIAQSPSLSDAQRARLLEVLASKLSEAGVLRIVVATERSQHANKEESIERLRAVLAAALKPRKKRTATKPTMGSKLRRLEAKRRDAKVKRDRRSGDD